MSFLHGYSSWKYYAVLAAPNDGATLKHLTRSCRVSYVPRRAKVVDVYIICSLYASLLIYNIIENVHQRYSHFIIELLLTSRSGSANIMLNYRLSIGLNFVRNLNNNHKTNNPIE